MKTNLIVIMSVLIFISTSCGARKKKLEISKGATISTEKTDVDKTETVKNVVVDTSKIDKKVKEKSIETITEVITFDSIGRLVMITKNTKREIDRNEHTQDNKYISDSLNKSVAEQTNKSVSKDSTYYSKELDKESKPSSSSWLKWLIIASVFVTVAVITIRKTL